MWRPTLTFCALLLALACAAAAGGAGSDNCTRRRLVDDASVAERESAQYLRSWRRLTWRWLTGGDAGDERLGGDGGDERIGDERRRLGSASDDPCGDHSGHHIPFTFNDVEQFALFYIALWACGKLAEALWLPSLAGELLCGMVLGPRLSSFVPKPDAVMMIGQVGLVLEMVSCGLEADVL